MHLSRIGSAKLEISEFWAAEASEESDPLASERLLSFFHWFFVKTNYSRANAVVMGKVSNVADLLTLTAKIILLLGSNLSLPLISPKFSRLTILKINVNLCNSSSSNAMAMLGKSLTLSLRLEELDITIPLSIKIRDRALVTHQMIIFFNTLLGSQVDIIAIKIRNIKISWPEFYFACLEGSSELLVLLRAGLRNFLSRFSNNYIDIFDLNCGEIDTRGGDSLMFIPKYIDLKILDSIKEGVVAKAIE